MDMTKKVIFFMELFTYINGSFDILKLYLYIVLFEPV